jgi:hypothetical protein
MEFALQQFCISQDGISLSWIAVAAMLCLLWFKRVVTSSKKKTK